MPSKKFFTTIAFSITIVAFLRAQPCAAQSESVLVSFSGANGNNPQSGLILSAKGVLYGTTENGGTSNNGTVYELTHSANGWNEKVIHNFGTGSADGTLPVAGLVTDSAGNLYGTTKSGGAYGDGTAFELVPRSGGGWTEKILHSFKYGTTDGSEPYGGLVLDSVGNLYGTCWNSGNKNNGTVFELTPGAKGWQEKTLVHFNGLNGAQPVGSLIFDSAGNLYGTTLNGGTTDAYGTVFELSPVSSGAWTLTTLHNFDNYDGEHPAGGLVFDASGNLYGTVAQGDGGFGDIFSLTPDGSGAWTFNILFQFTGGSTGGYPGSTLIFDGAGNLYGNAYTGGQGSNGVVFELSPAGGGAWNQTILHSFVKDGQDGTGPGGALVLDKLGNLYGTTTLGGTSGEGTVYEVTP